MHPQIDARFHIESINPCVMDEETNPGGSRLPVLQESSSCTICSLTPPSKPISSSHGEVFCLSCLLSALIEKHQDGHQEPAILQDSESSHEGDLDEDVDSADAIDEDVEVLVQKALSETRREQVKQLQQLDDNLEHLKITLVCALGLRSLEDRAWIDEAIAERLETRREIAWLERPTLGRL